MATSNETLHRLLAEAHAARRAAEHLAELSRRQMRQTTLDEYLTECHHSVFTKLRIQTNRALQTGGSITNPQNKWCPTQLRPWSDFIQQQRETFGALYDALPPTPERAFESPHFLSVLGERVGKRPIADEKGLEFFMHTAVEDPVRNIVDYLVAEPSVAQTFDLGRGIVFENHPHALSEVNDEVLEAEANSSPPRTPGQRENLNKLQADQICIYRSDASETGAGEIDTDGPRRTRAFISEYKPPHKLTTPHLRLGLRSMNIHKEVVNRKTMPTSADPESLFAYHADRLTASALTQVYNYMIDGGLTKSLLTNGESFVWLKIDWNEPETLYYHLTEPGPEVQAQFTAQTMNAHLCTAVGQYLSFALMAIGDIRHGLPDQDEREKAKGDLKIWAVDFESTYRSIPADESQRTIPDSSPGYQPTNYREDRSPIKRRNPKRGCAVASSPLMSRRRDDRSRSPDDGPASRAPQTPTPAGRHHGQDDSRSRHLAERQGAAGGHPGKQKRQYCTQKCLLGLVQGGLLDEDCPNVGLHCQESGKRRRKQPVHSLTHSKWLDLLGQQLQNSLVHGISPLGRGGARGELFKVTLLAFGYTFVAKGTIKAFIPNLEHEADVYRRLASIQGVHVPVFLGAIDLRPLGRTYHLEHRVYIIHFTLLSWGGESLCYISEDKYPVELRVQHTRELVQVLSRHGIAHDDVRPENILLCPETNKAMIIDFERSRIKKTARHPLAQIDRNKRASSQEAQSKRRRLNQAPEARAIEVSTS